MVRLFLETSAFRVWKSIFFDGHIDQNRGSTKILLESLCKVKNRRVEKRDMHTISIVEMAQFLGSVGM